MPNSTYGFTGSEIVSLVMGWIGNSSTEFQSMLESFLPLAESRFCKAHDWPFLHKINRSLTVVSGTNEYTLDSSSIGYYMSAEDVKNIYCPSSGKYLQKVSLDELRRMDPESDDGTSASHITHWAPAGDNVIVVYPATFADTTLKVDGKTRPTSLVTLSNYPTIPFHYQESFIQYMIALGLDRENDDRATNMKLMVKDLIKSDIQDSNSKLGVNLDDRIRHQREAVTETPVEDPLNMLFDPN